MSRLLRTTGLVLALATVAGACVSRREVRSRLGTADESAADAVGHVTVSAAMFTPIETAVDGDRRLDFGQLRTVDQLRAALLKPAFSSERKEYSRLALALAARVAGAQLSSRQLTEDDATAGDQATSSAREAATRETTGDGKEAAEVTESETTESATSSATDVTSKTTTKRSREVSRKTPDLPTAPAFPDVPAPVMTELVALLKSADPTATLTLPPDELASLIASTRAFMINLEEFHNVEGYDFVRGLESDYVPYKMHFSVTVEPGWYSRWYEYDAVAEVKVRAEEAVSGAGSRRPSVIVLGASPAETGQTTSDFVASLDQLGAAIDVAGSGGSFSAAGKAEYVRAVAERLMALRSERTLTVAFPDTGTMRVRFQAARIADATHRRDVQPMTRMLTATVLVRRELTVFDAKSRQFKPRALVATTDRWESPRVVAADRALETAHTQLVEAMASASGRGSIFGDTELARFLAGPAEPSPGAAAGPAWQTFRTEVTSAEASLAEVRRELERAKSAGPSRYRSTLQQATILPSALRIRELLQTSLGSTTGIQQMFPLLDAQEVGRIQEAARSTWGPDGAPDVLERARSDALKAATEAIDARRESAARRVDVGGVAARMSVRSYFSPSVFNENGRWAPVRDLGLFPSRPSDRLRADSAELESWIPPWLGEARRGLEILAASGYYRIPLAALDDQVAAALEAREVRDDKKRAEADVATKLAKLKAGVAAAAETLSAKAEELKLVLVAEAGATTTPGRQAATERRRQLEGDPSRQEPGEVATATAALNQARAAVAAFEPVHATAKRELDVAESDVRRAQIGSLRARGAVLRRGRVVVRFSLRGPSSVVCGDGALYPAKVRVRLVGLDDCVADTNVPTCSSSVVQDAIASDAEPGRFDGVFDLAGVDLSFAIPPEVGGVDDVRKLRPVRLVLRAEVLRGECPDCAGNPTQEGVEQSIAAELELRPWTDPAANR